jgi:hypothetical protein
VRAPLADQVAGFVTGQDCTRAVIASYGRLMSWWQAAGWGLAGGLAAGVLALMTAVTSAGFRWPWKRGEFGPRLFVLGGGLLLGALVAAASHAQMSGAWPAFVIGAGAPATIRGLLSGVEVRARPSLEPGAGHPAIREPKPAEEEGISENAG